MAEPVSAVDTGWVFLDTGAHTGLWNMEYDEHLARLVAAGMSPPAVRLYRWTPPAISLGLHQDRSELDERRCATGGVDIVRRPTGGRAILHDEELTYSVAMPARGSVMEVYNRIARALVRGLRLFGAPVEMNRAQPARLGAGGTASSIPCFTSTGKYEIEWKGRKVVGSAQRQYRDEGIVLQHGSILTGPAHRRLIDYLTVDDTAKAGLVREMTNRTTDLREILGVPVNMDGLAACVRRGFEEEWGITFRASAQSEQEESSHAATV